MKSLSVMSAALFVGLAPAQLAIPRYASTVSSPYTAGFYFQVPVTFTVTGLLVPDELKRGKQTVALYDLPAAPAAFPASTAATPVFFQEGAGSNQRIVLPTPVTFSKGRWFCVLGACGTKGKNIATSVGGAPFTSSVLGSPTVLKSLVMTSIGQISAAPTGAGLGRVCVFVQGAGRAIVVAGFSGPGGDRLGRADNLPPNIGSRGGIIVTPGNGANKGGILVVGHRQVKIPYPGVGTLFVGNVIGEISLGYRVPRNGTLIDFVIPNTSALVGKSYYVQGIIDYGGNVRALTTNAMQFTIGR